MIRLGREVCGNLEACRQREWLETNGLGGFASSTIACLNTRRYHGLLVAAARPPVGRLVLLAKLEETLVLRGRRIELSANRYPGVIHPRGYEFLVEFRLDPFPVFTYAVEGIEIEKRLFMVHGENTTAIEYRLPPGAALELRPLLAFRDYHHLTHRNDALRPRGEATPGEVLLTPYAGLPNLHLAHNAAEVEWTGHWYENFEYAEEQARGLDYREDLFNPLVLRFQEDAVLIASTERHDAGEAGGLRRREVRRRAAVAAGAPSTRPLVRALTLAADQFLVQRGKGKTILAGYPWFTDWGRDTMIALPGLTLATGRFDAAREVLATFSEHLDQGMLPNRFPDAGEAPEYHTADATLWFFEAVRAYLRYSGDAVFVRERLYGGLASAIAWHLRGTRHGIRADGDGLLLTGEPGVQLTWMDAKVGDWVVTPRHGKPVEIQALWYNALRIMEDLAARFGDEAQAARYGGLANRACRSFRAQFWNPDAGCLFDVVAPGEQDPSLRPNQIFAVSLPYSMLENGAARQVVEAVERELRTPLGLRTLSPRDPRYRPRYEGGVRERDGAYHQGAVWPWLLGPFLTAYVRVHGRSAEAKQQAALWLEAFEPHLRVAGLGQVSELADGDPPHTPRGCIAQAWSVGELLRAAVEDVYGGGTETNAAYGPTGTSTGGLV